jgi:hypothetical protein
MALETREAMGALTEKWRELGHDVGFGIGIAHGYATLGTIGFEGRFDYAAIGTVSNVASRLCDEAKPGQILISPRVFTAVKDAVTVERWANLRSRVLVVLWRHTMCLLLRLRGVREPRRPVVRVSILSYRPLALWLLGYPEAALAEAEHALKEAREVGQAAALMYALAFTTFTQDLCGNYAAANALDDTLAAVAEEKGSTFWKAQGMIYHGCVLALTGKASDALEMITAGISTIQSSGRATAHVPWYLSRLAMTRTLGNSMTPGAVLAMR